MKIVKSVRWPSLFEMKKALLGVIVSFAAYVASCDLASGLDNEALRLGKKYYEERIFLQCGDSWFRRIGPEPPEFQQLKNLEYVLQKSQLGEADKANGIDWNGRLAYKAKIFRVYATRPMGFVTRGWSPWTDWDKGITFSTWVSIHRVKGQWQVGTAPHPNKIDFGCSQIPAG